MKNLLRKHSSLLVIAVLLACFLGIGTALQPAQQHVAHAGTNGQQLKFYCNKLGKVDVYGTNQDGNPASWEGYANDSGSITTWGWWWKGVVSVKYIPNGVDVVDYYFVPPVYSSDIFLAFCKSA